MKKSEHLLEESILPTWLNQRTLTGLGYTWIWVGMSVIIATFSLGAGAIAGLSLTTVLLVVFSANLTLGLIMCLMADIGTEHGISFAVYLRAIFGTVGTHIPSVSRGLVAAAWFGIQTYLGALALNGIANYLIGFDSWVVWYIVFGIVQVVNTAMGIKAVKIFSALAAPAIILISIWMFYTLNDLATQSGNDIWTFVGNKEVSMLVVFVANMSWWSALAVDIPNITRFLGTKGGEKSFFKRNKNIFVAQLIALPVVQTWIVAIGAVSFIAAGDWNPITVIQQHGEGFTLIVLLVMITLAQWSTNTAANLIPAALTFVNAGAPKVTYAMGVVIAGIVGTLVMPWSLLNHLFQWLGFYGAVLSAMAGIMVCDYYVLRGRRLNVPELFTHDGQFFYKNGFNIGAYIAWILGGSIALYNLQYAYLFGFPIGFITYYLLMKGWILKTYPQKEIVDPDDNKYLATTCDMSWVYDQSKEEMLRVKSNELTQSGREDL